MFIANTERVHYYPSIGKNDKVKTVSCSVNASNSVYIFQENKSKKQYTNINESSRLRQNTNKQQQLSRTSAHTDYVFLPHALINGNGKVISEYLKRLKNKKINSYINMNVPVNNQPTHQKSNISKEKVNQQIQNIHHQSRSDLDRDLSQTDRKNQNQYIYERESYSVQRNSKKRLVEDSPIRITYQLREIHSSSRKDRCNSSKQHHNRVTQKKTYKERNHQGRERDTHVVCYESFNTTETKEKRINEVRMQKKMKNSLRTRTKFLQDEVASGEEDND